MSNVTWSEAHDPGSFDPIRAARADATEHAIEQALQEMWDQMTRQPAPDTFYVDPATGEWLRLESERLQRLREVTSPLGLARLFPALHSLKKAAPS